MIRPFIVCLTAFFGFSCTGSKDVKGDFSIIPYPNQIETSSDCFLLSIVKLGWVFLRILRSRK